jgi:predicted XRE-type DNA-binding protein
LLLVLRDYFREHAATQAQIGKMLRIPQPRVSELVTGKVDKFSADKLIGFLANVGIRLKPSTVPSVRRRPPRVKCEVLVSQAT